MKFNVNSITLYFTLTPTHSVISSMLTEFLTCMWNFLVQKSMLIFNQFWWQPYRWCLFYIFSDCLGCETEATGWAGGAREVCTPEGRKGSASGAGSYPANHCTSAAGRESWAGEDTAASGKRQVLSKTDPGEGTCHAIINTFWLTMTFKYSLLCMSSSVMFTLCKLIRVSCLYLKLL